MERNTLFRSRARDGGRTSDRRDDPARSPSTSRRPTSTTCATDSTGLAGPTSSRAMSTTASSSRMSGRFTTTGGPLRLAIGRVAHQRASAVHDRDRRPERPLPPRPLPRAERAPADRDPRLAGLDRSSSSTSSARSATPGQRRRPGRRVRPRHPIDPRLRAVRPDPRARLEQLSDRGRRGRSSCVASATTAMARRATTQAR